MPSSYLELWYEALSSPLGIVCSASDVKLARQKFYQARRESGDPALEGLSLRLSPLVPNEEIWIVKDFLFNSAQSARTLGHAK